jgi:hypothetical protein
MALSSRSCSRRQAGRGQTAFRSPAPGARNRGSRPIAAAGSREGRLGSTTSRSKPPHDRSAVRPEADTMNQTVRSRFTSPERDSFKPAPLRASSNSLNYRASNIRTKMAVVRLLRRKWAERDEKRPETGASSRSSWFGQFARNGRSLRLSDRGSGAEKECPDRAYWRSDRNCGRTLSA